MSKRSRQGSSWAGGQGSAAGSWTDDALCWGTVVSLPLLPSEIMVLRVAGEVDLATLPALEGALTRSIARRPRYLVVDLAPLEYCSAQGMGVLLGAGVTARERGVGYAISSVPPHLDRLWHRLWPDELPSLYPSAATAVAALRTRQAHTGSPVVNVS